METAKKTLKENGFNYNVKITLQEEYFNTRTYGNLTFPAGQYTALKVILGEGEGENWWCVMFPPLCFVDAAMDDGITKILSEEELDVISPTGSVNIKFKIVDFFQNSIHSVKTALKR